jgi:hypothetical protein
MCAFASAGVFLCSVVAYFLITWGNLYVDASMVGAYSTVQPVAAVLAAILVIAITPPPHFNLEGTPARPCPSSSARAIDHAHRRRACP